MRVSFDKSWDEQRLNSSDSDDDDDDESEDSGDEPVYASKDNLKQQHMPVATTTSKTSQHANYMKPLLSSLYITTFHITI